MTSEANPNPHARVESEPAVLIARLTGNEHVHELVREGDGRNVMRTYVRERDMDRELTSAEAGEWCDTVRKCGGEVRRGVAWWPEKVGT